MEHHQAAVAKIAAAARALHQRGEPYRILKGSTNSTRPVVRGARRAVIDISPLSNVVEVDARRRVALVEPNVPMDRLVEATLRHGLVPPVVMEFPGITVGGGFAGTAGESSSFRHGFFDDIVTRVEMMLADGQVVWADSDAPPPPSSTPNPSPNPLSSSPPSSSPPAPERQDLFRGAAGAVGTLGTTTLVELRLMEAKRFVRARYRRTSSVGETVAAVREEMRRPGNDYVDGILFSKDHGVVIAGTLTDDKPAHVKPQTFSAAGDPWFYLHTRDRTRELPRSSPSAAEGAGSDPIDYIPLAEYLFRYDRGGFWVGAAAFRYFWMVPFNAWTRWFLDDFLHTRMMYRSLHGSGESSRYIVQDLAMPFETAEALVDHTSGVLNIWPLWLCPLKRRAPPTFHPFTTPPSPTRGATGDAAAAASEPDMMLNVGVWGEGPRDRRLFVRANRELEANARELGGMKWLYAHTYYEPDEFWDMYGGRGWYDALRDKYGATALPTVRDKVFVDVEAATAARSWRDTAKGVFPIGGLWGLWKAIQSRDYLLHRSANWKWKGEDE